MSIRASQARFVSLVLATPHLLKPSERSASPSDQSTTPGTGARILRSTPECITAHLRDLAS